MKFFLRLRHWQIFLLTWGTPMVLNVFLFSDPILLIRFFPVLITLFMFATFGWIWSIGTVLHKRLPNSIQLNLPFFHLCVIVPVIYSLAISFAITSGMLMGANGEGMYLGLTFYIVLLVIGHITSMVMIFLALRFAAKTIKTLELNRPARFNDYIGEFFLVWFMPLGVWVLQPRLNKLLHETR